MVRTGNGAELGDYVKIPNVNSTVEIYKPG